MVLFKFIPQNFHVLTHFHIQYFSVMLSGFKRLNTKSCGVIIND